MRCGAVGQRSPVSTASSGWRCRLLTHKSLGTSFASTRPEPRNARHGDLVLPELAQDVPLQSLQDVQRMQWEQVVPPELSSGFLDRLWWIRTLRTSCAIMQSCLLMLIKQAGPQRPNEDRFEESGPLSHAAGIVFEPLPGAAEVRG